MLIREFSSKSLIKSSIGVANFGKNSTKIQICPFALIWHGTMQGGPKERKYISWLSSQSDAFPKKIIIFIWIAQISLRTRRLSCRAIFFGKFINQNDCLCVQWKRGMRVGRESFSTIKIPVRIINMSLLPSLLWRNSGCSHTTHHKFLALKCLSRLKNNRFFYQDRDFSSQLNQRSKPVSIA